MSAAVDGQRQQGASRGSPRVFRALGREWRFLKKNRELLIMCLPALILMALFHYLPMGGIILAFKHYRYDLGILGSKWVGFKNFEFFFTSGTAWTITRNTVLYNLAFLSITTITSLALAIMLNELRRRWIKVHQTAMFLPYFLSWVVVSYIVLAFLDNRNGYLNALLASLGMDGVRWYFEPKYWPYILNLVHLWKSVGFTTLVYYAGLMGIDTTLYEAAMIDGASKWQMVRYITLPLLTPLVAIMVLLALGGIIRGDFGLFFFVPSDSSFLFSSTDIIDTYVYRALTEINNLGMGAAVGLYQSVVGLIAVVIANYIIKRVNPDHALW